VLRRLLSGKWVALTLLAVLLINTMVLLGRWQWHRAQPRPDPGALNRPPVALSTLARPGQRLPTYAAGQLVEASGSYDADYQLLAPGRRVAETSGSWVLTPLRLADGAAILVVRGLADTPGRAVPVPTGVVDVTGRLQPDERPATGAAAGPAGGSGVPTVDAVALASRSPYPLLDGYLVLTGQRPTADASGLVPVPAALPPPRDTGLHPVNLAYALQWWVFAAFVAVGWWRMLRDDGAPPTDVPVAAEGPIAPDPALDERRRLALQDATAGNDDLAAYNRYLAELASRAEGGQ
jgi:cytochrome oxidase assembly protein ShyY1